MIKYEDGEWCVYKHDGTGGKTKTKCYPTEAAAKAAKDELTKRGEYGYASYIDEASAKGIWAKVKDQEHPHAACVRMMAGKVDEPNAFCAAVEKAAAGTTPAERAAKKHAKEYAHEIKGVEIFATGTHNGDSYDERDLDDIVSAFQRLDFQPPLKSGHSKDEPGMPSLGYVSNLRRQGKKLVADFTDLPQIVYDYIKDKRFNRVSSEVYWNLKRGDGTFRRALKAVALLGAEIPAVAGLRPLHELFSAEAGDVHTAEAINLFSSQDGDALHGGSMTEQEIKALQDRLAAAEADKVERDKKAKEDADKIAKLEADNKANAAALADLTKRFESLSVSAGDLDDVRKNALVAEAKAKADTAERARAAAEAKAKAEADARAAAEETLKAEREKTAKLEEDARRSRIEKLISSVKVPAVRAFVAQFADMATRVPEGQTKVYVQDLNGGKVEAFKALEDMIKLFNSESAKLFTIHSLDPGAGKPDGLQHDAPDMEVDRLTKKYMQEHKDVSYTDAFNAVLAENPELKRAYVLRLKPQAA